MNESLLAMSLVSNGNNIDDNSDTLTHVRDSQLDTDQDSSANKGKKLKTSEKRLKVAISRAKDE